jgi:hypothetical protein
MSGTADVVEIGTAVVGTNATVVDGGSVAVAVVVVRGELVVVVGAGVTRRVIPV